MPWQCKLVDSYAERRRLRDEHGRLPPGTMWHDATIGDVPAGSERPPNGFLSVQFYRDHSGKRRALWVRLPDGHDFCVDSACYDRGRDPNGNGWTVTGEPPNITVSPSINCVGSYHGWLQNGVLSDDVEGRTYPPLPA